MPFEYMLLNSMNTVLNTQFRLSWHVNGDILIISGKKNTVRYFHTNLIKKMMILKMCKI